MYVITGATGNTGKGVALRLLKSGYRVRVVGRDRTRLSPFAEAGADLFVGSLTDPAAMKKAFAGASAAYLMIPPSYQAKDFREYQRTVIRSFQGALKGSEVTHVVALSSVGAQLTNRTGLILVLHEMEEMLNGMDGLNSLVLRPGFFMENILQGAATVSQGWIGGGQRSDLAVPMISTKDIASVAAGALSSKDFRGYRTQELLGPKDVTMNEFAAAIARRIRREVRYRQLSMDEIRRGMVGMGVSENVAALMIEMLNSFNEGYIRPMEERSGRNTTPTTLDDFVEEHRTVFENREAR